jgi:hypothetical protein
VEPNACVVCDDLDFDSLLVEERRGEATLPLGHPSRDSRAVLPGLSRSSICSLVGSIGCGGGHGQGWILAIIHLGGIYASTCLLFDQKICKNFYG